MLDIYVTKECKVLSRCIYDMPEARLVLRVLDMAIRDTSENRPYILRAAKFHGKISELESIDTGAQYINKGYWPDLEAIGLNSEYVLRVLQQGGAYPADYLSDDELNSISRHALKPQSRAPE